MKKILLVVLLLAVAAIGASAQTCVGAVQFQLQNSDGSWSPFDAVNLDGNGNYTLSENEFVNKPVGSYQVQAVYMPSTGPCLASTSAQITVTVTSSTGPSTTTLNITPNPLVQNSGSQTFSGSVTLNPGSSPAKVTVAPSAKK